jgi:hypothetical protein
MTETTTQTPTPTDAHQLDGVTDATKTVRKPRTTQRAAKPGVTKTVPAKAKTPAAKAPAPKAAKATPAKSTEKQELARTVVTAIGQLNLTKEQKAIVSQWIHHLPAGSENGKRWWPKSLPRPDRSDWR